MSWTLPVVVLVTILCWASGVGADEGSAPSAVVDLPVRQLLALITAIGALGTAAFGLVDASKVVFGGPSNAGTTILYGVIGRFADALLEALGSTDSGQPEWKRVVRANWMNGRAKDEQKAVVKSLIRLGLTASTVPSVAKHGHVSEKALAEVVEKLQTGATLADADLNVLGRLDASIDAQLEAAFNRADQFYRNGTRAWAGAASVVLSVGAAWATGFHYVGLYAALVIGLLAVPFAPIAKDLSTTLQAAATAVGAAKKRNP
jgi:hypothetical protein